MTLKDNQENEFVPRSNRKSYRSKPQRSREEMFVNAHLLVPGKTKGGGNQSLCHVGGILSVGNEPTNKTIKGGSV